MAEAPSNPSETQASGEGEGSLKPEILVEVVSDVTCPWCWVSKRRLEHAMGELRDKYNFRLRWEPYLLRPQCPRDGIATEEPVGGDPNNPRLKQLKEVGKDVGIDFTFLCPVYPYTVPAHVLIDYAKTKDGGMKQDEIVELLFEAYFTKGSALTTKDLLEIADQLGFDTEEVEGFLGDPEREEVVKVRAHSWKGKGVKAIPFFFMNGLATCSGAQEVQDFRSTILKVAEKFPLAGTDETSFSCCLPYGESAI